MKRLFLAFTLCLGLIFSAGAQVISTNTDVTSEDYQNYLEGKMKVEFRKNVIQSMNLTEDQIIAFDPIFNEYMNDKKMLVEKKYKLIQDYKEEMEEDDTAKDEDEETAGFIENFWEVEIKEMELQKDFFDRFEEVVTTDKAINFFFLEDEMVNQVMRPTLIRVVPMIVEYGPVSESDETYDKEDKMDLKEEMKDTSSYHNGSSSYMKTEKEENTWNKTTEEVEETTETAWNETKQEVNETAQEVEETTETAWNETKQEVNETAQEVEETTETAWNETKQEVNETTQEVESENNWTEKTATTTGEEDKVKAFSSWVETPNGKVSLSHQYTHDGLMHVVSAIWTIAERNDIDVTEWETKKQKILDIADQIQVDMYSTDHADHSREAFIMIAEMIDAIQNKAYTSEEAEKIADEVAAAARAIDPDVLMTPQAEKIYTFFDHTNKAVKAMSAPATAGKATDRSAYNNSNNK